MKRVVEEATMEALRSTGGAGFPLLYCGSSTISAVKRGIRGAGATVLVYNNFSEENCDEVEVEEWLRKGRGRGVVKVLIADHNVSRSWECSHVLVVDLGEAHGFENLVMRTVGYCALVKQAPPDNSNSRPVQSWSNT